MNRSHYSHAIRAIGRVIFACFALICLSWNAIYGQEKDRRTNELLSQGESAFQNGKFTEALALFNECIKQSPAQWEAYLNRALARQELKDFPGALTDFSIYLEQFPQQAEALLGRGTVRFKMEKYEQAREDFLQLLRVPVGETAMIYYQRSASASGRHQIMTAQGSAIRSQALNYLGLVDTRLKHFKEAVAWLDSAIRLDNKEADFYVNRGIAKEGLHDTTALRDYRKALELHPQHTVALHNLSVLKRKMGIATHQQDLENAIESDSSMLYPYLERAYQRMEGGFLKGALDDYNHALKIEDKDPDIWLNRGLVREKMNDLKGAYADYTKAISLRENYDKAWLNRGNVLSRLGRSKEAIEDYSAAITFNPNYAAAFYNRAIAKDKLKQTLEACDDLKKAELLGTTPDPKLKLKVCGDH